MQGDAAKRMKAVKQRLAELGTAFTQNLLADERDWFMEMSEDDLEGLPGFAVEAARAAGEERGVSGPVVTLSRSLITPFLQFSPRRDLRERAYKAWVARGANGGETDNRDIAAEILSLREERAKLLGYSDFASYKLETEMAGSPDKVRDLLISSKVDDENGAICKISSFRFPKMAQYAPKSTIFLDDVIDTIQERFTMPSY